MKISWVTLLYLLLVSFLSVSRYILMNADIFVVAAIYSDNRWYNQEANQYNSFPDELLSEFSSTINQLPSYLKTTLNFTVYIWTEINRIGGEANARKVWRISSWMIINVHGCFFFMAF